MINSEVATSIEERINFMKNSEESYYRQLVGCTVVEMRVIEEAFGVDVVEYIVEKPDGTRLIVYPLQDEEGNGPGFLEIQHVD